MSVDEYFTKLNTSLPSTSATTRIPAFFIAHGSPMLIWPKQMPAASSSLMRSLMKTSGPDGPLANFLKALGPFLLQRYRPKAILVFSAHWETERHIEVMANDNKNELLYDYYNFPDELYKITWKSYGSSSLAKHVKDLLDKAKIPVKLIKNSERGFDHGVFVPFIHMFPEQPFPLPVIEVSIDSSLDPEREINLGKAIESLRDEGVLILSGGLSIHNLNDLGQSLPDVASPHVRDFEKTMIMAAELPENRRLDELKKLVRHPGFRLAHPREEHFVPMYVAAGAGSQGEAKVLCDLHGAVTIAFGL
ncbi:unnamed protein product [Adineta ricciae]|uniref:Extradiol ring-cleavage dioxygenase class III enzyme subunit B domain-containing protein n=1 Tax=Adineta ricciae TaxID=249248 RepID=A0A813ZEQ9_ADIRI|nr:unnamed protein product [Adineta ricciae]